MIWDDIKLENQSAYPLTHVVLDVRLVKGEQVKTVQVKVDYLGPGQTKTWANVVTGVSGTWDKSSAPRSSVIKVHDRQIHRCMLDRLGLGQQSTHGSACGNAKLPAR